MTTYEIEPTPDAIDPLSGKPTGEHDILMLCADGIRDWIGTYANKREAQAELRNIKVETAACEGAERHYQAQHAYACGYWD